MPFPFAGISGTGAAAGAGAAAGGFPWAMILPILASLIPSLFGKSDEEKQREELLMLPNLLRQMGIRQPYQSRYAERLDPMIAQAIIANLKRTANWGWPEGMGMDLGFLEDFLANPMAGSPGLYRQALPGGITRR